MFGFKQRGEAAVAADNLFYYLCYEGGFARRRCVENAHGPSAVPSAQLVLLSTPLFEVLCYAVCEFARKRPTVLLCLVLFRAAHMVALRVRVCMHYSRCPIEKHRLKSTG